MIPVRIAALLVCAALAGCVTTGAKTDAAADKSGSSGSAKTGDSGPGLFESKSAYSLRTGLSLYADGKFDAAAKELQNALDQGLSNADQIKAHKNLAFIHCVSGRKPACRSEFLKALDIDPNLELEPAEAGHPIWGPVFKSAKLSKLKGDDKPAETKPQPKSKTKAAKAKSSKTSSDSQ